MTKPLILLKYLGGKSRFLHIYRDLYKNHTEKRWVDVFCGGISAPLNLKPERVWINDKNQHLINFYSVLQHYGDNMPKIALKNEEEYYYEVRKNFNKNATVDPWNWENAHQYLYLNKTCFNGLMRFNKKGEFNSPFGHYGYPNYPENLNVYQDIVAGWRITCNDWTYVLNILDDNDFVVCDPPYVTEFTAYTPEGFKWKDQVDLAERLSKLNNPVVLHNQSTPEILKLYTDLGFDIQYFWREDTINSHRKKGNKVEEVIATRNI